MERKIRRLPLLWLSWCFVLCFLTGGRVCSHRRGEAAQNPQCHPAAAPSTLQVRFAAHCFPLQVEQENVTSWYKWRTLAGVPKLFHPMAPQTPLTSGPPCKNTNYATKMCKETFRMFLLTFFHYSITLNFFLAGNFISWHVLTLLYSHWKTFQQTIDKNRTNKIQFLLKTFQYIIKITFWNNKKTD